MSTTTLARPPVTPDDLLKLPDAVRYELVDGELVERNMGAESSFIALQVAWLLGSFLESNRLGFLFGSDTSYLCFATAPGKVRRADVAFIRMERLPNGRVPRGHVLVAPDLAIEVVSPNDTSEEVDEKVLEWLAAGVPLVWVVTPSIRAVRIHRARPSPEGQLVSMLSANELITGEDVLPGFSCAVMDFFENT